MTRYSIALTTLLSTTITPHFATAADPWSYLSVDIPVALSDMAVTTMTYTTDGGNSTTAEAADVKKKIILTGGCVSEKGNEYLGEYFACLELTNKAFSFEPIAPKTQFQAWTGTFAALPDMPRERNRHGSFQVNNNLCVVGGRDTADNLVAAIDCYDATTNAWTEVGTLPEKYMTSDFASYTLGDKVYIIGGYNQGYEALSQVVVMDMSNMDDTITFEEGVPIDTPRGDIFAVPVDDESTIMISGGFTHLNDFAKPLDSVEQYEIGSDSWEPVDALNEERGDKQLINLNGKIYAIGGEGKVDSGPGITVDDPLVVLAGGSIVLDTVEVLDITVDGDAEWVTKGDMPASLFRFGASGWVEEGSDDGVIFVFGGQVGFEAECECFRTTEKVMVFNPSQSKVLGQSAPSAGVAISVVVGHVVAAAAIVMMLA